MCVRGIFAVLVLELAGCAAADYTRRRPPEIDLIGKWIPTRDSMIDMRDRGGYSISQHEVELRSDGTFSVTGIPDWVDTLDGSSFKQFKSGVGNWTVSADDYDAARYVVQLHFYRAGYLTFHVVRQARPYLLYHSLGDPDARNALVLERADSQQIGTKAPSH